jgi:hypothetical protein
MRRKYPREIQGETKDGHPIPMPEPEPDYQDVANISAYLKQRAKAPISPMSSFDTPLFPSPKPEREAQEPPHVATDIRKAAEELKSVGMMLIEDRPSENEEARIDRLIEESNRAANEESRKLMEKRARGDVDG